MGRTDPSQIIVCDAGPLIHLDEIDQLYLLNEWSEINVPSIVWEEVRQHKPNLFQQMSIKFTKVSVLIAPRILELSPVMNLDLGEQAALSLMEENPDALLLTDDTAARLAAEVMGYRVHGTIGILIRSIRKGRLESAQVINLLGELPHRSSLHIKSTLLKEIIERLRKEFP